MVFKYRLDIKVPEMQGITGIVEIGHTLHHWQQSEFWIESVSTGYCNSYHLWHFYIASVFDLFTEELQFCTELLIVGSRE